ncbi:MAG: hypothetical protein C0622_03115 [Desulfuromonas sp.]|nr:MAG: hypothetical protein C0622_03115 [Desulfuromonas sp.]
MNVSAQKGQDGFTLVELMVVAVIMGLVIASIYGLFSDTRKSSVISEEVVDVQQNLRIAMETMVADIRMAGFLIPDDDDAIASTPATLSDVNTLSMNLATSSGVYARVTSGSVVLVSGVPVNISVDEDMAHKFSAADAIRLVEPSLPEIATDFSAAEVTSVNDTTDIIQITPAAASAGVQIDTGNMVTLAGANDLTNFPVSVVYDLVDDASADVNMHVLRRIVNGTAQTIATNINSVALEYIPSATDLKAVRVTITASTDSTRTGSEAFGGAKTRTLQTVVKVRNMAGI